MSDPFDPSWQRTLGDVERSVADCLAALDRYEAVFAGVLGESATSSGEKAHPSQWAGVGGDGWDARLSAAKASVNEIDRLLAGSEAGWAQWREAFSTWRRGIEQPPEDDKVTR